MWDLQQKHLLLYVTGTDVRVLYIHANFGNVFTKHNLFCFTQPIHVRIKDLTEQFNVAIFTSVNCCRNLSVCSQSIGGALLFSYAAYLVVSSSWPVRCLNEENDSKLTRRLISHVIDVPCNDRRTSTICDVIVVVPSFKKWPTMRWWIDGFIRYNERIQFTTWKWRQKGLFWWTLWQRIRTAA